MECTQIQKDVFLLNDSAMSFLYAPLQGKIVKCSSGGLSQEDIGNILGNTTAINSAIKKNAETYFPQNATLILTSDCQLRCKYCYSEAGNCKVTMKPEVAKAAIDLIVKNASLSSGRCSMGFAGGGEPTYAWGLLETAVSYFNQETSKAGLIKAVTGTTNGQLTESQLEFIAGMFSHMQISADGPEDIQNRQRPPSSHNGILRTIQFFEKRNFPYNVRVTVTNESVGRMQEIYEYFNSIGKPIGIQFEPAYTGTGRGKGTDMMPFAEEFIANYAKVKAAASKAGRKVVQSGSDFAVLKDVFCGAAGQNFCITPEGFASSCFEVTMKSDPRSGLFFYGNYDSETGKIKINEQLRSRLAERHAPRSECEDCFLKHSCKGGCHAKFATDGTNKYVCDINQGASLEIINRLFAGNSTIEFKAANGAKCEMVEFSEISKSIEKALMMCHGNPNPCPDHCSSHCSSDCNWVNGW